jgi:septal ring factor EnvC (AmiA/AmiB activator)
MSLTSLVDCPRARSNEVKDALTLDLTQQWDFGSFVSDLDAMSQTTEVTDARAAAMDVNAKVEAVSNAQAQLTTDVASLSTAMNDLNATLMDTLQDLHRVVDDFSTLVRNGRYASILP